MALFADRLILKDRAARARALGAILLSALLLLLPWMFPLDGKQHADWQQFLGRFHPLAVHLPIGLIVLVPLLELAGLRRPALREAAGFILRIAFICCLGALTLGYLLAYGSGTNGTIVQRHLWGGITLSIGVLACIFARSAWTSHQFPRAYPALLVSILGLLAWTAHQGGSLTYGVNYLTEYLPAPLKNIVGDSKAPSSASFYAMHIHPILDANCLACHGETKANGGLRMDTYDQLMRGGKDGPAIVPGKPETSLLLQRVTLPVTHKLFMPAEGKPPLKPDEIDLLRAWVRHGASSTATVVEGISIPEVAAEPTPEPVGDYSSLRPEIDQLNKGQGVKLLPVSSKPSDGLILSTIDTAPTFGDAQLRSLEKYFPFIVEAELGRTVVTNASFDALSKCPHLRAIHLEWTGVTGDGIAKLAALSELTYLNLTGTRVSAAAAASLGSIETLRHVYLYNTPAQPAPTTESVARNTP
jgi:hypothetical protein